MRVYRIPFAQSARSNCAHSPKTNSISAIISIWPRRTTRLPQPRQCPGFQPPPQRKRVARLMAIISPEWRGTFWVCVAGRCTEVNARVNLLIHIKISILDRLRAPSTTKDDLAAIRADAAHRTKTKPAQRKLASHMVRGASPTHYAVAPSINFVRDLPSRRIPERAQLRPI